MANAYQKKRNKDRKHAALIKRDPLLHEKLYGIRPPEPSAETRDTAHKRGHEDG